MPTGYTAPIAEGITFKKYAMGCARAFGALIMMRDDPSDAEIPEEFEPSTYHRDRIEEDSKELKALLSMTVDEATAMAKAAYEKDRKYHSDGISKDKELLGKYQAMLSEVESYVSPSPDHDNFKKFMADQIRESINFDCNSDYHQRALDSSVLLDGRDWIESEKNRLNESLEYHRKNHQEELDRTNRRSEWVKKLRDSLE